MDLQEFALKYRVNFKRDECGEEIIRGRKLRRWDSRYPTPSYPSEVGLGQIYQYAEDGSVFGMIFMPRGPHRWANVRKRLLAAGFRLLQDGDWEGSLLFDPTNAEQANAALKAIGARRKRQISEATRLRLAEFGRGRQQARRSALCVR